MGCHIIDRIRGGPPLSRQGGSRLPLLGARSIPVLTAGCSQRLRLLRGEQAGNERSRQEPPLPMERTWLREPGKLTLEAVTRGVRAR
jgi:hypothetical protein